MIDDLKLVRHSGANHKRETIAFSKRRQAAVERLGLRVGKLAAGELLRERLFPSRVELPRRLQRYYRREVPTRQLRDGRRHRLM